MLIFKKKNEMHDKTVLLEKDQLHTINVLISKILIDSYFSQHNFFLVNNVLREYHEMKEEIIKS